MICCVKLSLKRWVKPSPRLQFCMKHSKVSSGFSSMELLFGSIGGGAHFLSTRLQRPMEQLCYLWLLMYLPLASPHRLFLGGPADDMHSAMSEGRCRLLHRSCYVPSASVAILLWSILSTEVDEQLRSELSRAPKCTDHAGYYFGQFG